MVLVDDDHELFWSLSFGVSAATWDVLGGFDTGYVGYGAEDTDLAYRARSLGRSLAWFGGGTAFHQWHPPSRLDPARRGAGAQRAAGSAGGGVGGRWMGGCTSWRRRSGRVRPGGRPARRSWDRRRDATRVRRRRPGPDDHGVVRYARRLRSTSAPASSLPRPASRGDRRGRRPPGEVDVLHVHYTDQLFGRRCEQGRRWRVGSSNARPAHRRHVPRRPRRQRRRPRRPPRWPPTGRGGAGRRRARRQRGRTGSPGRDRRRPPRRRGADVVGTAAPGAVDPPTRRPWSGCSASSSRARATSTSSRRCQRARHRRGVGHRTASDDHDELLVSSCAAARPACHSASPGSSATTTWRALPPVDVPVAAQRHGSASASLLTWIGARGGRCHGACVRSGGGPARARARCALYDPTDGRELARRSSRARRPAVDRPGADRPSSLRRASPPVGSATACATRRRRDRRDRRIALRPEQARGLAVPDNRWDLVATRSRRHGPARRQRGRRHPVLRAAPSAGNPLRRPRARLGTPRARSSWSTTARAARRHPRHGLRASVLRQADFGHRAAAARNRGVRATAADVLVFLDADTIRVRRLRRRIVAWPAVLPDAVVVGRRRHADLGRWTAADSRWFGAGDPPCAVPTRPGWPTATPARPTSSTPTTAYRYVISSVMAAAGSCSTTSAGSTTSCASTAARTGRPWPGRSTTAPCSSTTPGRRLARRPGLGELYGSAIDQTAETLWLAAASRNLRPGPRP